MKKKKIIYLLVPLVVIVWGFVFYQLSSSFLSTPNYAKKETLQKINIDEIKRDTFSIVANYRDPFLGTATSSNRSNGSLTKKTSNKPKIKTEVKAEKPWPIITYKGMIKNNNSEKRVGIIKIDGKEYLVKEGDLLKDLKIIEISKQLIKVNFQKESKSITK